MILLYIIGGLVWLLVHAGIYGSAVWFGFKGLRAFPKKAYYLLWPILLIGANLYAGLALPQLQTSHFANLTDGRVTSVEYKPVSVELKKGYLGCDEMCMELLVEGHVKQVRMTALHHRETKSRNYSLRQGDDCFTGPYPLAFRGQFDLFYGDCVQMPVKDMPPTILIVMGRGLNDLAELTNKGSIAKFENGVAILKIGLLGQDLLSVQGNADPEILSVPLTINLFEGGFEGSTKGRISLRKRYLFSRDDPRVAPYSQADLLRDREKHHEIINRTLDLSLDGEITGRTDRIDIEAASHMIAKAYANPDRLFAENAKSFADTYENYPFLEQFRDYMSDPRQMPALEAERYVVFGDRQMNPEKYRREQEAKMTPEQREKRRLACERVKLRNPKRKCSTPALSVDK